MLSQCSCKISLCCMFIIVPRCSLLYIIPYITQNIYWSQLARDLQMLITQLGQEAEPMVRGRDRFQPENAFWCIWSPGHESGGCKCHFISVVRNLTSSAIAEMATQSYVAVRHGSTLTAAMLVVTVVAVRSASDQLSLQRCQLTSVGRS